MLKEFYDFIAKRINRYFLEISAEGALQKGESFYLKLDDLDTVQKVADEFTLVYDDELMKTTIKKGYLFEGK